MRVIKKIGITSVFLCIILTQFVTILHADSAMLRTVVNKNDLSVGGDFWLDLQIKITDDGTSPRTLNSFTADIYYTSTISYNGSAECVWALTPDDGYGSWTASDLDGYVRLGVIGSDVGTGQFDGTGWDVTTEWQNIVTVKFTITTATNTNISINDNTDAAAYFNNLQNDPEGLVSDWTTSNEDTGDVTLPVVLSAFTCQYINNIAVLYWVTESETDNLGWFVYRNEENDFTTSEKISEFIEGYGTTTQQQSYLYEDRIQNTEVGNTYYYWLESIDYSGMVNHYDKVAVLTIPDIHNPDPHVEVPRKYGLQSGPNPFNSNLTVSYMLPKTDMVRIEIYNMYGQLISQFNEGLKAADKEHTLEWDGKDLYGQDVSSGVLLIKLITSEGSETKKAILLR